MKIGIIREGKIPPDSRVVLTPDHCHKIQEKYNIQILVEHSENRCFDNGTYSQKGIKVVKNIEDCSILLGVKEVPIDELIPNKTYFFFSHTIKGQVYNRKLLQAILDKKIRLIDYEVLTNEAGQRVIAFGRFAGMVGAHNALYTYGQRTSLFHLDRMTAFDVYNDAVQQYRIINFPNIKVVVTGMGRVANGACEVLDDMGFTRVKPLDFTTSCYNNPVYTQLDVTDYARHKEGKDFSQTDYFENPQSFESNFRSFYVAADIFINGIFWDTRAPAFFTTDEMKQAEFQISVIADVTCDIAPETSVPSTLRASTIADPIYGYDPRTGTETKPFQTDCIDVMAVDNLPNEMPKDASTAFGEQFIEHILPILTKEFNHPMIQRATIAVNGHLGPHFQYLQDFVNGAPLK
ncbi:MAG: NAD(P)-dependent oxidoreductase [Bacteroidia bacterium]|nr:NAD(P)-dependent oxidoreductase [Bacteroidia bacterium]